MDHWPEILKQLMRHTFLHIHPNNNSTLPKHKFSILYKFRTHQVACQNKKLKKYNFFRQVESFYYWNTWFFQIQFVLKFNKEKLSGKLISGLLSNKMWITSHRTTRASIKTLLFKWWSLNKLSFHGSLFLKHFWTHDLQ